MFFILALARNFVRLFFKVIYFYYILYKLYKIEM